MASKRPFPEDDFLCPVCRSVFRDPVVLPCGHSGCKECVEKSWRAKGSRQCPLCRKVCTVDPPRNTSLRNLCRSFLEYKRGLEEMCVVHQERPSLFCCDDKQLLCELCKDSEEHSNHTCRPVGEVAEKHKGDVRSKLNLLTTKMKMLKNASNSCYWTGKEINDAAKYLEKLIRGDIEILRQWLMGEEENMITELQEEKERKVQTLRDKSEKIKEDMASLSSNIRDLEETLESGDVTFLLTFKDALKRVKNIPHDPEESPDNIINHVKYFGNLKFNVWKSIRRSISYSPVLLNRNTANIQLGVSEDLTEVWYLNEIINEGEYPDIAPYPRSFERFKYDMCVLGSVGYSTGTHTWDVEVEGNNVWVVGVATESVERNGRQGLPQDIWAVGFEKNNLSVRSPLASPICLTGFEKPKQVRVELDMSDGRLSFSDPQSDIVYYTFTHNFREKLFPFFHTLCLKPLKILPVFES